MRRLDAALRALAPGAPGHAVSNTRTMLYPHCGGPRSEIDDLLEVLLRSGLAQEQSKRIFRTRAGHRLVAMNAVRGRVEFRRTLIRRGWFHDQVPRLLSVADSREDQVVVAVEVGRQAAPQLFGVLTSLGEEVEEFLVLRGSILADLDSPWCLIPSVAPGAPDARLTIGKRGEAYSYQYLRHQAARLQDVLWVAADDESLGYDLEHHGGVDIERIEVKASTQPEVRCILSANEYRKCEEHGPHYTLHFWGGVNLHRDPQYEYDELRDQGYPKIYQDVSAHIDRGVLRAEPREWVLTEAES